MFEAKFRGEIGKAIPHIVEWLKDSDQHSCRNAMSILSLLGAYRTCPYGFPLPVS